MGTRADFYVGRGEQAEWLGSIAWDGFPTDSDLKPILDASQEADYRLKVDELLASRKDATLPEQGWPWPWKDSQTTDYAYAFDDGKVWASNFGYEWFDPHGPEPQRESEKAAVFPNMTSRKSVTYGARSGLIVMGIKPDKLPE